MKFTLILASLFFLGACASSKKSVDSSVAQKAPVAPTPAVQKSSEKNSTPPMNGYTCQVLNDKRVIEFKTEGGRCEIHYTKFGNLESVAWAQSTPSICSDVFARIRSNIEQKGFSCENLTKNLAAK